MTRNINAALALLIGLSGCISIPHQTFDRRAHTPIKRIALLPIPEPKEYEVSNLGGVAGAFGLIGAAVQAAAESNMADELTQQMRALKLALGSELMRALEAALVKRGYTVVRAKYRPITRDEDDPYEQDYSRIQTDADAILDVWFFKVGYLSPPDSGYYHPWIRADARLLGGRDKAQRYFQAFSYGAPLEFENIEHFRANAMYKYDDFDALMASAPEAAEGLREGIEKIAFGIAQQLR